MLTLTTIAVETDDNGICEVWRCEKRDVVTISGQDDTAIYLCTLHMKELVVKLEEKIRELETSEVPL